MRIKYTIECTQCKMQNYIGKKNKNKHPEKVEVQKYCSTCKKKVLHKEKK